MRGVQNSERKIQTVEEKRRTLLLKVRGVNLMKMTLFMS